MRRVPIVDGLGGADRIGGGADDDIIDSGTGADLVFGGTGADWIFAGRDLGDEIFGEEGDDTIYGSHLGADILHGGDGQDRIFGKRSNRSSAITKFRIESPRNSNRSLLLEPQLRWVSASSASLLSLKR